MPSMADLTVKKNDGTTDIVFNALSASAGDTVPAQWRQDTGNTAPTGLRPIVKMVAQDNGPRTARRVRVSGSFPFTYVDTPTSLVKSNDKCVFEFTAVLPGAIPQSALDEGISQFINVLGAALVRASVKSGFGPT